jgi:hypothetical protein
LKPLTTFTFILFFAQHLCFAHKPYEVPRGDFLRSDGAKIHIVERFTDGILGPDPSSVIFRVSDGKVLAETTHNDAAKAVRIKPLAVEILEFDSNWIPIGLTLQVFNGYTLTNAPAAHRVWLSPAIHVGLFWRPYLFCTLLLAATVIGFVLLPQFRPESEWGYLAKFTATLALILTAAISSAATLLLPTSPLIVALAAAAIVWAAIRFVRPSCP